MGVRGRGHVAGSHNVHQPVRELDLHGRLGELLERYSISGILNVREK